MTDKVFKTPEARRLQVRDYMRRRRAAGLEGPRKTPRKRRADMSPAEVAHNKAYDREWYQKNRGRKLVASRERAALVPRQWWRRFKGGVFTGTPAEALACVLAVVARFHMRHVRDDAAAELMLALLEGRVAAAELAEAAIVWHRQEHQPPPWCELREDDAVTEEFENA